MLPGELSYSPAKLCGIAPFCPILTFNGIKRIEACENGRVVFCANFIGSVSCETEWSLICRICVHSCESPLPLLAQSPVADPPMSSTSEATMGSEPLRRCRCEVRVHVEGFGAAGCIAEIVGCCRASWYRQRVSCQQVYPLTVFPAMAMSESVGAGQQGAYTAQQSLRKAVRGNCLSTTVYLLFAANTGKFRYTLMTVVLCACPNERSHETNTLASKGHHATSSHACGEEIGLQ